LHRPVVAQLTRGDRERETASGSLDSGYFPAPEQFVILNAIDPEHPELMSVLGSMKH
jgi:hypothetical protein